MCCILVLQWEKLKVTCPRLYSPWQIEASNRDCLAALSHVMFKELHIMQSDLGVSE